MNSDFRKAIIQCGSTIREGMKQLNESAEKNLYVVNASGKLVGSLTDGDIRRGILRGISLEEPVETIMFKEVKCVSCNENRLALIKSLMLKHDISSLPVVDINRTIVDIVYWIDIFSKPPISSHSVRENKVFILAGGMGTRLDPFTKILPKPLIPVGDQPIIERIMDAFSGYGYSDFIISLNHKADMIKTYLSDESVKGKYKNICYIHEPVPLGTIGSLYLAKDDINGTFIITNADILVEEDLEKIVAYHKERNAVLTIVGCVKNTVVPYGVLNIDEDDRLISMEEKPSLYHLINTGVYIAEPQILSFITAAKKCDATQLIHDLLQAGENICVYPVHEEQWFDIGQWTEYDRTKKHFESIETRS